MTTGETTAAGTESTAARAGSGKGSTEGSGSGSREFTVPGGDNSVQEFGKEASAAERAQASTTLETT